MNKFYSILILGINFVLAGKISGLELPSVYHYTLHLKVYPAEQRMEASAEIKIRNNTDSSFTEIPLLLYRLLNVEEITGESGIKIKFNQSVQRFKEVPKWQFNLILIELNKTLLPDDSSIVKIKYSGFIYGYTEVMPYVKDRIDEQYSLLRPDAFAYPILSTGSLPVLISTNQVKYTYEIDAIVPSGYVVACGGRLEDSIKTDSLSTFIFHSKGPSSRMDIAIARFRFLKEEGTNLSVYFLPEDEEGAVNVLSEMKRVSGFYTSIFGEKNINGYTAI